MWNMAEKVLFLGIDKRNSGGKPDLVRFHVDLEFICGFCEGEVFEKRRWGRVLQGKGFFGSLNENKDNFIHWHWVVLVMG